MRFRRIFFILVILIVVAGIAWAATHTRVAPPAATPVPEGADKAGYSGAIANGDSGPSVIDYARLDRRLRLLAERPGMVGLAVGVVENGEIRFVQGYGITAAGTDERVTADTVFRWASLSKGVAGDMVGLLASEGKLSLFDPVNRWSSSLRLPGGAEARATVSDVLTHRLGLFSHAQDSKLEDNVDPRYLRSELATLNLICAPGQCHAYQNVAYDTASEIVERATGRPYRDVVRERLFRPIGMTSATMSRAELMAAPSWARPHIGGRNSRPQEVAEAYYRVPAAGGVNSSIKDLALWMRAQMGLVPNVLPPSALALIQERRARTPAEDARHRRFRERISDSWYGLGWRIFNYSGHRVIGHHGGVRGYRSLVLFDPERKAGVVALWNSPASQPNGIEIEVMDMIYGLPFHDWLDLDRAPGAREAPVETETEGNEVQGQAR